MFFVIAITALIILLAVSVFLIDRAQNSWNFFVELLGFAGYVGVVVVALGAVGLFFSAFEWIGAQQKANIINREYGTNYTQAEVFYASSVINTIRELDRRRIEINGDIRRQRDPQRDLGKPDNR